MIPRTYRISGAHLRRTLPRSRASNHDWGIIRYSDQSETTHIACIVSKKIAKSSPDRHRIKRRVYSIVQPLAGSLQSGCYYLFPNKTVLTTNNEILTKQLQASFERFKK